jgi:hypothetical protein
MFLAAREDGLRDLYRAIMPVTPEGHPLGVRRWANLTQTSLGDETGLSVSAGAATYSTVALGHVSAVSVIELHRDGWRREDEREGVVAWTQSWLSAALDPGYVDRTHFGLKATSVEVRLKPPNFSLRVRGAEHATDWDLDRGAPSEDSAAAHNESVDVWHQPAAHSQWVARCGELWARALSAAAVLRAAPRALPDRREIERTPPDVGGGDSDESSGQQPWPPADITPVIPGGASADDGRWQPMFDGSPEPSQAPLQQAELALSLGSGGARLRLVAVDTRQLDLRIEGGYRWPQAEAGPPGTGRLPLARSVRQRVVGAFPGSGAAARGMMVRGRLLSAAEPGMPTLVKTEDGRVGLGEWPASAETPRGITSFRQTRNALVTAGRGVPSAVATAEPGADRSALCVTSSGTLVHAAVSDVEVGAFAEALVHVGCHTAVALDVGRSVDFMAVERTDTGLVARRVFDTSSTAPGWRLDASESDFFYLVSRSNVPSDPGVVWTVSPGSQPDPVFVPGLFAGHVDVGNLDVELFSVLPGRAAWTVTGGSGEPLLGGRAAPKRGLSAQEQARVLFAFDSGHTTRATRYGLAHGARQTLPLRRVYPTLALAPDGGVEVFPAGHDPELDAQTHYVQLPDLVRDGELTPRASETGSHRRRGALCAVPDGRIVAAFVSHDTSAPLALWLRAAGCDTVLELDRASQHAATLYRQGSSLAVPVEGETTLLVGLSRPMPHGTFRFGEPGP